MLDLENLEKNKKTLKNPFVLSLALSPTEISHADLEFKHLVRTFGRPRSKLSNAFKKNGQQKFDMV